MSRPSAFKTPEGEAAFLAAYDAAMKLWPVPYEEMDIPTQCGMTHVVVSGPKDAPPVVLLHGYWATSTMWVPNIADFSTDYRLCRRCHGSAEVSRCATAQVNRPNAQSC